MTYTMKNISFFSALLLINTQTVASFEPQALRNFLDARQHEEAFRTIGRTATLGLGAVGGITVLNDLFQNKLAAHDALSMLAVSTVTVLGWATEKLPSSWAEATIIYPLLVKGGHTIGSTNVCASILNRFNPLGIGSLQLGDQVQTACKATQLPMTFAMCAFAIRDIHNRVWNRAEYAAQKYDFGG